MSRTIGFVARFLGAFAVLVVVAIPTRAPQRYGAALTGALGAASPAVSGWWIETRSGPVSPELWLRRGDEHLRLQLSPDKLALSLFPFLSLIVATPALGWRRVCFAAAIGSAALFLLDLLLLLLYPFLARPGMVADIAGTFLGLLVFVAAPAVLWFVLTFDRLAHVWRLADSPSDAPRPPQG